MIGFGFFLKKECSGVSVVTSARKRVIKTPQQEIRAGGGRTGGFPAREGPSSCGSRCGRLEASGPGRGEGAALLGSPRRTPVWRCPRQPGLSCCGQGCAPSPRVSPRHASAGRGSFHPSAVPHRAEGHRGAAELLLLEAVASRGAGAARLRRAPVVSGTARRGGRKCPVRCALPRRGGKDKPCGS